MQEVGKSKRESQQRCFERFLEQADLMDMPLTAPANGFLFPLRWRRTCRRSRSCSIGALDSGTIFVICSSGELAAKSLKRLEHGTDGSERAAGGNMELAAHSRRDL